ncbi:hypothetical protein [Bacillus pinisoli]|uniref:hypothetical protein n=1 Tax=Bacillus pinisoli TaxID=2901866 RepID=UPI001FF68759|nr:hypothetical protein [Bacillus pinisoli]
MDNLIAIELIDDEHHDLLEPFLPILSSFKEKYKEFYLFSSREDVLLLEKELKDYFIIQDVHSLYVLRQPQLFPTFSDYGFTSNTTTYLFQNMVSCFAIKGGNSKDVEMAMLQFDEHLIAINENIYFVDLHHQALIEKIANAYHITISFFELDK